MTTHPIDPASRARVVRRLALEEAVAVDADDYSVSVEERDASPSRGQLEFAGELVARMIAELRPELVDDGDLAEVRLGVEGAHLEVFVGVERLARIPRVTLRIRPEISVDHKPVRP